MSNLCNQLVALSSDPAAPAKVRQRATCLHDRLTQPLQFGVGGPDAGLVAGLCAALPRDPAFTVRQNDIGTVDIAVWCTLNFGADEVAFWDAAPPALQDHSLLLSSSGNHDAHIQDMGHAYFRQGAILQPEQTLAAVVDLLLQQVRHGQEADEDQARALLARHPQQAKAASIVLSPPCDMTRFLQGQAEGLARMHLEDTPDCIAMVLERCTQTVADLTAMISDDPDKALQDAVFDAADAMTLMQLEGDMAAAVDAVTLLIDLKSKFNSRANI